VKFPVDAPLDRVICSLQRLGFVVIRSGNHISLVRQNADGSRTPITIPAHRTIKASTLRTALSLSSIPREDFLAAYEAC
jgi:predicted RNA binding protein YcfA (HicA-like mRNA interferase family)